MRGSESPSRAWRGREARTTPRCARSGSPVRAAPSDAGDLALAGWLGGSAAPESYVASIDSGGDVVALLYADNLPSRRPLGDSQALEVVLHHAGLALERTMLERALAEAEAAGVRGG